MVEGSARVEAVTQDERVLGSFTYAPGIAQQLDSFAGDVVRTGTGRLAAVGTALDGQWSSVWQT